MTTKTEEKELQKIKHHLYDFVKMDEKKFNVNQYREKAVETIQDIFTRTNLAVVVGETNYYIESIAFNS